MKILLVEPFLVGSHQRWAEELQQYSTHEIKILSLEGRHWKWRMYGGAVSLAQQFLESSFEPDLILASDMLNLPTFLALTKPKSAATPCAVYFHENQITYPWSPDDEDVALQRNNQYGFINYTSALAADALFFNSQYHLHSFIGALPDFLQQFPDHQELPNVEVIRSKSSVLHLGLDLVKVVDTKNKRRNTSPVLLWNHRWEYDKNPELFFQTLAKLSEEDIDFKLIVVGKRYQKTPEVFTWAKAKLQKHILHWGYAPSQDVYFQLMGQSDILPVTNFQDFFGGSVVEAIYCGIYPLLPNRLAYPEHIPPMLQDHFLYQDDEAFYLKLKQLLHHWSYDQVQNNRIQQLQNFVSRYDWSNLADQYDHAFLSICND